MKKIMTILFILIIFSYSKAEIPGVLELNTSVSFLSPSTQNHIDYNTTKFKVLYGTSGFDFMNIYGFFSYENNFQTAGIMFNRPFRDVYSLGIQFKIIDIFYLEYGHICSHRVVSSIVEEEQYKDYVNFTSYSHNYFKIGTKFVFE